MLFQVGHQIVRLPAGELHLVHTHELGPAETVGAVGVAGLAGGGEKEHGFTVFMLHSLESLVPQHRNVELDLASRVWIHFLLNLARGRLQMVGRGPTGYQVVDFSEVLTVEHLRLGKGQLENRVFRDVGPVDQVLDHVVVHAEGQDGRDGLHAVAKRLRKRTQRRNRIDVLASENTVLTFVAGAAEHPHCRPLMQRLMPHQVPPS